MSVSVLYFAACRECTGKSREDLDLAGQTIHTALDVLRQRHPRLADVIPRCRVALNQSFASASDVIPEHAELALIPPVAGG